MGVQDAFIPPRSAVQDVAGGSGAMTDNIVAALRKTRPWVLFLSIMGFIGAAFMALASIPMLMGSALMGNMEGAQAELGIYGTGMMVGMGVMYLLMALVYFMASLYLLRYAGSIKRAVTSLDVADLETALGQQASFWKLAGIMALVFLVLMVVMMVVGIGGAIFMGGRGM
ncbi:DUF5362 family protein [Candidatus Thiothrix sp. Deng01]|uniref:DUF5362 family protein n=1 Tax=Candidatus Thiothrix phosphatis TaxID=3112415 RepID=A0ABU6CYK1_9GAMM|nr:DUF5362 family protein [Candidatus Thiothrix sp. Deng01]MEB4591157.1 DUF5362 family protein [Candidatus Thiothrix sp. Deng01]